MLYIYKYCIIIYVLIKYGDVFGFDSNLEVRTASSGFAWPLKKAKININADNRELAYAA